MKLDCYGLYVGKGMEVSALKEYHIQFVVV